MWAWLKNLGSENHADERLAERWHLLHAGAYGLVILLYCGSIAFHLAAASRHRRAIQRLDSARRGSSGVSEVDDDGG